MKENNPHKYFNTKKDYTKWDNFIKQIDDIDLSDEDKLRARNSISYLEKILGKDFFSNVIQSGHPLLAHYFMNAANLARIQLIDFAEALQALENSQNFDTLIYKIKKAKKFSEGSTILKTAHKFHKIGFSVAFDLYVSFMDGMEPKTKQPDIKITNEESKEEIYIEVSEKGKSEAALDNRRTYLHLFRLIRHIISSDPEMTDLTNPKHILPHLKILRAMTNEELIKVSSQINEIVEDVRNTGKFQEIIIGDMIEIAVSPFNDHSRAKAWAKERNIMDFVENCFFNPDELSLIRNRLKDELEQLPLDKPGMIVLWNNSNLLFFLHGIEEIINKIINKISAHPNVYGVAFNYDIGLSKPENGFAEIENHLFVSNTGRDLITRNTLLVRNKNFNLPMTDATEEKLLKSFIYSSICD